MKRILRSATYLAAAATILWGMGNFLLPSSTPVSPWSRGVAEAAKNPCNPGNPCTPKAKNPCNPCAVKASNPCNPGAAQAKATNPCNPCNPCAPKAKAKNPCNPCNPGAAKKK